MNLELIGALSELEKERGISKDILLEAIEVAIVSAYKRNYGANSAMSVRVELNEETGEIQVFSRKVVVEEPEDAATEIGLAEAQELDPNFEVGDIVEQEVTPRNFGRIAAQTAKQVVIQRIREAERNIVYNEYADREGDVVTGIIQRAEHRNIIVDLGRVEAVLPASEQIPREVYRPNDRLKFYISEVKQSTKGPQVTLSRTHPGLLRSLLEFEVPEIESGIVEIKAVAREAGHRSKIAVYSRDEDVDAVGACVGARGMRIQAIVSQIDGEKIDVVEWTSDTASFVGSSLSPAKTLYVVLDRRAKTARTVVPDDQLSLAIGKEGQNARLAARLTGWKIDIKSHSQARDLPEFQPDAGEPELDENDELAAAPTPEAAEAGAPHLEEPLQDEAAPAADDGSQPAPEESDEEPEGGKEQEPAAKTPRPEKELQDLVNVPKRKTWEERFGSRRRDAGSEKQESDREKRKKKEKEKKERVLKEFSMLDLEDFGFDDKEEK